MPYPFWLTKALVRTGIARWLPGVRRRLDGGAACLRYLSDRCLAAPLDGLADLAAYTLPPVIDRGLTPDAIDLAGLAPRLELPPPARTPAARGYPPPGGLPELRSAVADHLAGGRLNVTGGDDVLITAGATGAFAVALDTFVNPGDRVALFGPTSPLFRLGLEHRRARVRWVPTTTEDGRVRFGMESFTRALPRAKLVVLSQPANPTGGVFAPEDLEQIAWWANKFDVLIYCDESFARFRDDDHVSLGSLAPAARRTLTAGSVTFGWGLAAARVGWLAGYRHLVRPCAVSAAVACPFPPAAGQQAALTALRQPKDSFAPARAAVASKRRYAVERLTAAGLEPTLPGGGLFVWLPVAALGLTGRAFADRLFADKRVLVTPGELYGPGGEGHVRLSLAADDGRLREGLGRLAEFVGELRPAAVAEPVAEVPADESAAVG
ncbi:MAG TPA: pyridoxal phosphate-dependent aminotransferase [Gemmataceae bacterium]|jgi:aspartate/methionine/tyrosine aminotransferase